LVLAACGSNQREAVAWHKPVEIASGGGVRGPWQQNDSQYDYVDDPSVTLTPSGDAIVAWVDHRHKDVFWQVFAPDGTPQLGDPVNLSRSGSVFSWLPKLALARRDPKLVYVVWQEIVFSGGTHGGDIFFARSRDGGRTCEPAQNLSASLAGDGKGRIDAKRWHNGSFDLAVGPDDAIHVAWTSYEGDLQLRRSRDGGKTFEDAVVVASGSPEPARAPALAIGSDALYVAWTVGENASADIRLATSRDGRGFDAPAILERTPGYSDAPKLAVDAGGMVHVAYAESPGGPFERAEIRYTRARDGKTFAIPRKLSSQTDGAGFPSLAVDGSRVFVSWEHYPGGDERPRGLGLAYSLDGGGTFSPPSVIAGTSDRGTNGGFEGRLMRKLAVRGDAIVVVNSAVRSGESSRVWLVRGRLD
jgi:hypothetical protein